jgi:hypothetical protein
MKKGCFLTAIVWLTISIGIGFYIVKNYGSDIILFGKEKLVELAENSLLNEIEDIDANAYKDSLNIYVEEYITSLKETNTDEALESAEDFIETVASYLNDNLIDSTEFDQIKKVIKENERSKKN